MRAIPDVTANSHEFWLKTCGRDTYWRSSGHARVDTPWNAFTHDDQALVCTLWVDFIVDVFDPQENRLRRFVRLGGRSREWKGVAISHGEAARDNLDRASRFLVTRQNPSVPRLSKASAKSSIST
jgi:hypothetical protein